MPFLKVVVVYHEISSGLVVIIVIVRTDIYKTPETPQNIWAMELGYWRVFCRQTFP